LESDLQGDPIFLFEVEKFATIGGPLLSTRSAYVRIAPDTTSGTAVVEGLEAGYYYRVSELGTMRYELNGEVRVTDDAAEPNNIDEDSVNFTATFLLTEELANGSSGAPKVTVSFDNTRSKHDYLSAVAVATNSFTFPNPGVEPSEPSAHKVEIIKGNTVVATRHAIKGEMLSFDDIDMSGVIPAADGAIGTITSKADDGTIIVINKFYLYTPIPDGNCTIDLLMN
jgi:hypothetical protein